MYFKNTAHAVAVGVMDCCREKSESTKSTKKSSSEPRNKLDGQYHVLFAKEVG